MRCGTFLFALAFMVSLIGVVFGLITQSSFVLLMGIPFAVVSFVIMLMLFSAEHRDEMLEVERQRNKILATMSKAQVAQAQMQHEDRARWSRPRQLGTGYRTEPLDSTYRADDDPSVPGRPKPGDIIVTPAKIIRDKSGQKDTRWKGFN